MTGLARFFPHSPAQARPVTVPAGLGRSGRDPGLAEVLARLEVAAALGDADAAARLLDGLASGSGGVCGVWLHRQMAAAALRAMAHRMVT